MPGDDVYPVIPYFRPTRLFIQPASSPDAGRVVTASERNHRPRPSFTPYFIPEPRVLRPPEPTAPMAALAIPSTIAAPVASRPSTLVPLSLKFVAMQPGITASGVAPAAPAIFPGPAAVQPTTPALINVNSLVKKQILNSAKRRILRFFLTASAMAGTDESSSMPGMNVTIRTTSSERQQVTASLELLFSEAIGHATSGISQFLSTSALHRHQQLNYAFGAMGAAVKLALREQIPHPPVILPFTQHEGSETFEDIVRYIGNMDGVQRIAFDYRKSHMLSIGDSQVRSN
ncbi:hypothetical protein DEU56DRAFT_919160 [Suillus clintonianus]|uniref:uncharacterized protein n=1 Tax=Suillus clintonianus TaxID=1904413 RepID=UPI001B883B1E|nr:uncharacterized protein DEU56DRAFT_919160 [Suillus clintonianus]KAG2116853.1 hypothetical protein DEU56DRAFT_919160 [Suillus clintonianus]